MGLTPALFTSAKPDGSDPTKLQPSFWNRVVALLNSLFDGADAHGSLLYRNTADTTDGASYLPDVAVGSVLASGGVGVPPVWSANPTVTTLVLGTDVTLARAAAGKLTLTGTTPMLQLGGTTSSFPALKQNVATVDVKLADDSAFAGISAKFLQLQETAGSISIVGNAIFRAAPTISSGFGTSPSIANSNGTIAFTVNVGTGGVASSGVIGLPAASNGWICHVMNITAIAANRADQATRQTASTTNTVTVQNQTLSTGAALAWTAGDILRVSCFGY